MSGNRQNIIDATQRLLQKDGIARLTTRGIAREAHVAESLLYHHFKDKAELIHEVVIASVRNAKDVLLTLPLQVGTRALSDILEEVLYSIYKAHYDIVFMVCSIFSDRPLHARMVEIIREKNIGPHDAIEALGVFLAAEQRIGRLPKDLDPPTLARCLRLLIVQAAMEDRLMDRKADEARTRQEIRAYLRVCVPGLTQVKKAKTVKRTKK